MRPRHVSFSRSRRKSNKRSHGAGHGLVSEEGQAQRAEEKSYQDPHRQNTMRARASRLSPRVSALLDKLFSYRSIKRLPRNRLAARHHRGPFPKNRAQRSIGLLSVLTPMSVKHLMLCTRFACCSDRWLLKAPQSRNRCACLHPALVRAPCLGVYRSALLGPCIKRVAS